jgi:cytochrome P450
MPIRGRGLLTSEGDFWRRLRRLVPPAFQPQQIERYGATMVENTLRLRDRDRAL